MQNSRTFDQLNAAEAISAYRELGLNDHASAVEQTNTGENLATIRWPWNTAIPEWQYTSYAFGHISESDAGTSNLTITDAKNINADNSIKNSKINISLDFVNIYNYPGNGKHQVLLKFNAKNQFDEQGEDVTFNQTFTIQEGEMASIAGYPVFIGLNIKDVLVQFSIDIVNVLNDNDEDFMKVLNSDVVNSGLKLLNTVNPVMPLITQYASGITNMIAKRHQNVPITSIGLGLYFAGTPAQPKIAKGVYIAVQVPTPTAIDWSKWIYNRNNGMIQNIDGSPLKYNYFAFSIS